MREKKQWLIVTFDSTTDAMRMEKEAREEDIPGRIIPLPAQISAGCGLSWRTEPEEEGSLKAFMDERSLRYDKFIPVVM